MNQFWRNYGEQLVVGGLILVGCACCVWFGCVIDQIEKNKLNQLCRQESVLIKIESYADNPRVQPLLMEALADDHLSIGEASAILKVIATVDIKAYNKRMVQKMMK